MTEAQISTTNYYASIYLGLISPKAAHRAVSHINLFGYSGLLAHPHKNTVMRSNHHLFNKRLPIERADRGAD